MKIYSYFHIYFILAISLVLFSTFWILLSRLNFLWLVRTTDVYLDSDFAGVYKRLFGLESGDLEENEAGDLLIPSVDLKL